MKEYKMKKYFILCVMFFLSMLMISHSDASNLVLARGGHKERRFQDRTKTLRDTGSSEKVENETQMLSGEVENGVRVVKVKASQYKFEPDPIVVKRWGKVRLEVTSTDVTHGMTITDFNVNLVIPAGETRSVEFIADKKGHEEAYCSVYCGSGHGRMRTNLIVR